MKQFKCAAVYTNLGEPRKIHESAKYLIQNIENYGWVRVFFYYLIILGTSPGKHQAPHHVHQSVACQKNYIIYGNKTH